MAMATALSWILSHYIEMLYRPLVESHYRLKILIIIIAIIIILIFRVFAELSHLRDSLLQVYCLAFLFSSLSNALDFSYNPSVVLTNEKRTY